MQCKKCGTIIKEGEKFCGNCGEVVTQVGGSLNVNSQSVNNPSVQNVQPTSVNTNQSTIQQQPTSVNVSQGTVPQQQTVSNVSQEATVERPTSDWIGDNNNNNNKNNKKKSNIGIVILLIIIILLLAGGIFYFLNKNESEQKNNKKDDSQLNNNANDNGNNSNDDGNSEKVKYVLNDKISDVYKPITTTKIKTEDTGVIIEIDSNKNAGYYLESCGQNCTPTVVNINGEHAKYVAISSYGVAAMYHYFILTEEGNIYGGTIEHTLVKEAKKIETNNSFINMTYGGYRVEQSQKARSVLGVTSENDYYNVIYCPNVKSGNYLTYIVVTTDYTDPYNMKNEYILIYSDGSLSYLPMVTAYGSKLCDTYDYNQYIVNSNNEKIQTQIVFYKDGFYILGTDGYLYKLTLDKIGNNYIAELYNSKKVREYNYNQVNVLIESITVEYADNTTETFDKLQSRGAQIVMLEEK